MNAGAERDIGNFGFRRNKVISNAERGINDLDYVNVNSDAERDINNFDYVNVNSDAGRGINKFDYIKVIS